MKDLYKSMADLVVWSIESGEILLRPDLAMTYYPSDYDFYWFVARTVHLLE